MLNDLRHAFRMLLHQRAFSVVAVATLALGVGATTAIFSVTDSVILNPLPYPGGDRIVHVWSTSSSSRLFFAPSVKQFDAFQAATLRSIDALEAYSQNDVVLTGGGDPEFVSMALIAPGMLSLTGTAPLLGRGLVADDSTPGAAPVALISEPLWKRRFGGDPRAIGTVITLNDRAVTLIGVVPAAFRLPTGDRVNFVAPLPEGEAREQLLRLTVVARLRPGVTLPQAEAELNAVAASQPVSPGESPFVAKLLRPRDRLGPNFVRSVGVLFGAVACLLLIACANVANLVLARNAARVREIAVRRALGASAWTLARQLLVESTALALAAGGAALIVAVWSLELIVQLRPTSLAQLQDVTVSPAALTFNLLVSISAGMLLGVVPALRAARVDIQGVLKGPSQGTVSGGREWFRRGLLVSEIALALVLLTAAGLLARSFARLNATPLGFDSSGVVAMQLRLPTERYPKREARAAFYADLLDRVRSASGVSAAALAVGVPPRTGVMFGDVWVDGRRLPKDDQPGLMASNYVGSNYFEMLRIRLVDGRPFGPEDTAGSEPAIIINASTARKFWPEGRAVGARFGVGQGEKVQWRTVVGVVDDVKAGGITEDIGNVQVYLAFGQQSFGSATLLVRSTGDPLTVVPAMKSAVWAGDANLPIRDVSLASKRIDEALSPQRFNLALIGIFAVLGVLLAVIGVYGAMSYFAAQREHEMGVRLALGATTADMMGLVLRQAGAITAIGLVIGLGGAWWLGRFMTTLLFEIEPTDPATLASMVGLLACASLAGTALPAWRITRVDPTRALRAN